MDVRGMPGDGRTDWYNFGYWDGVDKFSVAAEALAVRLGDLAELGSCRHLLDIGVGFGGQLAIWKERFRVVKMTALEQVPKAWAKAKNYEDNHIEVHHCSLENFLLPESIDRVIAVDSCYHIPFEKFWEKIAEGKGVKLVAFSDLYLLRSPSLWDTVLLKIVAVSASIPFKNFRTKEQYIETSRMRVVTWTDVSVAVLDGFCDFVGKSFARCSWLEIISCKGLLKVYCTYFILKAFRSNRLIGYALISFKHAP